MKIICQSNGESIVGAAHEMRAFAEKLGMDVEHEFQRVATFRHIDFEIECSTNEAIEPAELVDAYLGVTFVNGAICDRRQYAPVQQAYVVDLDHKEADES